jgi:hypothetical protein
MLKLSLKKLLKIRMRNFKIEIRSVNNFSRILKKLNQTPSKRSTQSMINLILKMLSKRRLG